MRRHHKTPHPFPHDYTAEIEMLRQAVVALTYRQPGDAPPPFGLDEALTQTQQVAQHEQQRYRELFTFAPDGYLVTDLHGLIQEANQAAATLLHAAPDHLAGIPLAVFVAPEARQGFQAQIACLQNSAEVRMWEVPIQPWRQAAFPAMCSVAPARDVHGQVIGLRWLLGNLLRSLLHAELVKGLREELGDLGGVPLFNLVPMQHEHGLAIFEQRHRWRGRRIVMQILAHACGGLKITAGKHRGHGVRHNRMSQRQRNPRAGTAGCTPTHRVNHHHYSAAMCPQRGVNVLRGPCFLHAQSRQFLPHRSDKFFWISHRVMPPS